MINFRGAGISAQRETNQGISQRVTGTNSANHVGGGYRAAGTCRTTRGTNALKIKTAEQRNAIRSIERKRDSIEKAAGRKPIPKKNSPFQRINCRNETTRQRRKRRREITKEEKKRKEGTGTGHQPRGTSQRAPEKRIREGRRKRGKE